MIILLGLAAFILFVVYDRMKFRHWKVRGVAHTVPTPFMGHYGPVALAQVPPGDMYLKYYKMFKHLKYFGIYEYYRPVLVVNDLKLVERILVKDFSSFANHSRWVIDEKCYLNNITFNLRGNLWRAVRYRLTPSFSTSKMQLAFDRMMAISGPMFVEGEIEAQRIMTSIAADTIVSYFGAVINNKEAFGDVVYEQTYTSPIRHIKLQILEHFPELASWSGISLIDRKVESIMRDTTNRLFNGRGVTSEFKTLLEQIKKDRVLKLKGKDFDVSGNDDAEHTFEVTDELLMGQVSQFLFAGLDATANTMGFLVYELATNPEIQSIARKEALDALVRHKGIWSCQLINELVFIQNCIYESSRLHTVLPFLFREVTKDYTFPETNLTVKVGDKIVIPAVGFQTDSTYFPEPLQFKPERWSASASGEGHSIPKYTWLPFGEGPRLCLGMRFALLELKFVMAKLLTEFNVTVSDRTKLPAGTVIRGFVGRLDRPVFLKLEKIK